MQDHHSSVHDKACEGQTTQNPTGENGHRTHIRRIFSDAIAATSGFDLVAKNSYFDGHMWHYADDHQVLDFDIPEDGRLVVIGAGKAAASLARGLESVLGKRIDKGCIVVKYDHAEPLEQITTIEASHPVPDTAGVAGTQAVLDCVRGLTEKDRVFVALTGGASALLIAPVPSVSLEDKADATRVLLASGADISEMNTIRKVLSRVKGGRLLDAIGPAASMTLMISDIPSDDPSMIGSGPTWPDTSAPGEAANIVARYGVADQLPASVLARIEEAARETAAPPAHGSARHLLLADARTALEAARQSAQALGYEVVIVDPRMDDDTHVVAHRFTAAIRDALVRRAAGDRRPVALLAIGETTLKVTGKGRGGRNQEFALVAAMDLKGVEGFSLLASGTDGTDGPTEAAGAFADGGTIARADAMNMPAAQSLADNDSNSFFSALGDLHVTGPTGTNVMDLVIALVG